MKWRAAMGLSLLYGLVAAFAADTKSLVVGGLAYDPTSAYYEQKVLGWRVLVNEKLLAETNLWQRTLKLLETQLAQVTNAIPTRPLQQLQEIPIWVERGSKQFPCMCYHESEAWLRAHGVNPDKTGCVELANPDNFLTWTKDQPWMVLHELAHGYHQRFLGEHHPGIAQCYQKAKTAGKYDSVLRSNGQHERHYALNNAKEYFAEATEAFFGKNDFQPFTREELKEFDPEMHETMRRVWQVSE